MKKSFQAPLAFLLALSLSPFHALAQQPQQPPPAEPPTLGPPRPAPLPLPPDDAQADDEDDVVRITSNLVQFDVVVTDKKGRQVTDLKPEDFEVLSNGKPQQITNFSYVSNDVTAEAPAAVAAAPAVKGAVPAPPLPPARLKREQVRRTIAIVVDDASTSWTSVYTVRRALKKMVDEHMQPGDLVAIIRTLGGAGALQQFTSDKRVLYAAIESLRWYPQGGSGISPFPVLGGINSQVGEAERLYDEMRRERFTVGTLLTVEQVIRGLEELPGRKSLVLLGDGIPLPSADTGSERVMAGLNRIIETANRASVTVYPVDARGLMTMSVFDASNDLSGFSPQELASISTSRSFGVWESQRGMQMLAEETGGVAYRNTNDIGGSVRRALDDQKGFYLIGYRPEPGTFDAYMRATHKFHKLTVKVKRPGLRVRTRGGFFAFTDRARPASLRAGGPSLAAAISSPFGASAVPLRLTTLFSHDPKLGSFMRSMLHVDARKLTFREEPDGWRRATLDILAVIIGANGMPVGQINMTRAVRVKEDAYRRIMEGGLIYSMLVPAKKAGVYQLRVAVRDAATREVGSANQVIEVPDIKKGRLALSGILMSAARPAQPAPPQGPPKEGESDEAATPPDPAGGPALRRFRHGTQIDYAFNILNAKLEKGTGRPQLQTQMRLFRDGKPVYTGATRPFDADPQTAQKAVIGVGGGLRLDSALPPGEYVLQLVVTDLLAKEKHRTATQWIDFEIVTSDR